MGRTARAARPPPCPASVAPLCRSEPALNSPSPGPVPSPGPTLEEIRTVVNDLVPFQKFAGVEVTDIAAGRAVATLPDSGDTLNHVGTRHAAALFLVAEAASGAALAGALRERIAEISFVLRESAISYRRKARGEIRAVAAVPDTDLPARVAQLPPGERFEATTTSLLHDTGGEPVAEASFTYHCRLLAP
ncbi:DUF4442 domain-containing protein [Streptomyces sp. AV19]|uniref:DUF4442 domain-containing protein n=1 Tax=Streptomyces sp. AV19 TaxID=2793068 RepID=UPI0027DB946B|nr:DUF4442 domain-containing protein [Streptomyces sp. AV19]